MLTPFKNNNRSLRTTTTYCFRTQQRQLKLRIEMLLWLGLRVRSKRGLKSEGEKKLIIKPFGIRDGGDLIKDSIEKTRLILRGVDE
ncbi:CLUMA_CG009760, isoform A [Clunio marinus]|uniref:CLUMA_CG009760, isoform A n=1 Tax=Clunio marinus TaxID=568069 RepID=A0A1J1I7S7_9DIPT|nr:CLUMA_CG009760, isoform A [Clunio marinus]